MNYLVTGGTGFVGIKVLKLLLESGDQVVAYDIAPDLNLLYTLLGEEKGEKVFHSFNKVGNYTILLTITDINGGESTKSTYSLISEKINDEIIENSSKENSFPFLYVIIIFLIIVGSIVFIKYRGSDK